MRARLRTAPITGARPPSGASVEGHAHERRHQQQRRDAGPSAGGGAATAVEALRGGLGHAGSTPSRPRAVSALAVEVVDAGAAVVLFGDADVVGVDAAVPRITDAGLCAALVGDDRPQDRPTHTACRPRRPLLTQTLSMHSKSCWQVPPSGTSGVANVESHSGRPERLRIAVSVVQDAARSAARQASTCSWSYLARPAFSDCLHVSAAGCGSSARSSSRTRARSSRPPCYSSAVAIVQQSYAWVQIVLAKVGRGLLDRNAGDPAATEERTRQHQPVRNLLFGMPAAEVQIPSHRRKWRKYWGPRSRRPSAFGKVFSL